MKNLMIFVDPLKNFNKEHQALAKIQIDYSLAMGWDENDIMLVTNFPYEYNGVKSFIVGDDCYYDKFNRATKVPVINRLYDMGVITEQFWFHDFDAFQLQPLYIDSDFAITNYGWMNKWNAGSFFFKNAHDTFKQIEFCMREQGIDEENAMTYLIANRMVEYKLLNITYNIHIYHFNENFDKADKPIMVAHFHPIKKHHYKLFEHLIPDKLKDILSHHYGHINNYSVL